MLAVVMDLGDMGVMWDRLGPRPVPAPMELLLPLLWTRIDEEPDIGCFMLPISVESSSERLSKMLPLLFWLPLKPLDVWKRLSGSY